MARKAWLSAVALVAISAALVESDQAPATPPHPRMVRLAPADAARIAKEERAKVTVEMPPGVELMLWAPEQLVVDPVAIDLDERGTVYVTSSTRNNMPLDIRQHPDWFTPAHTLKTRDDLLQFYRREMSPEQSSRNTWIEDYNKDGSRDWRDLAEFKERVHRIEDTDGDGLADSSEILVEGFNDDPTWDIAGGILYHDGDLIVGVPPGVYRLTGLNNGNGGTARQRRIAISEGYNTHPAFGGHGISGVTLGPDGRIYWEVGDIGFSVVAKSSHRWSYPNQGAVLRANPDGSDFEVFATGIRNLQEFSFDEHGNLISVDNDGDHEGEFERLVYIPNGSDSGWRSNWQYGKYTDPENNGYNVWMDEEMFKPRFDGQAAHIIPPLAPWHAGPSGMVYNPGTALSEEWQKYFMVSSFPGAPANARVFAFTLKEEGAGFALDNERVLLRGILTVGMKIGPDGALYLTDWITGWDSKNSGRLWKLDTPQTAGSAIRKEVQSILAENLSARRSEDMGVLLRHADMRVRQKAQFELVRRGNVDALVAAARDPNHRLGRIHALWGIAQLARKDAQHASQLTPFLRDSDAEIRAQAARMIGDVRYAPGGEALLPLLKDDAARARFFAAEALGRISYKPAVGPLVEMLEANNERDVFLRHAGSLALARIGDAAAIAKLARHPSFAVRLAAVVALRRLGQPLVSEFLADSDQRIVTEAARAINDDGGIPDALPALAQQLADKRFKNTPLLRRAINANLRVGTSEALARVASFAVDSGNANDMRAEAIAVLGVWPDPSPLDRVDGMYIAPLPAQNGKSTAAAPEQRDASGARAAILQLVRTVGKGDSHPTIRVALADAARRLALKEATPTLWTQVQKDPSPEVRLAALRALQALKAPNIGEVMKTALADTDAAVRRAALDILPTLPLTDAAKVRHLDSIIKNGSTEEKQGAFDVLGKLKSRYSQQLLDSYFDQLVAGTLPSDVHVDLVDAMQASGSQALANRLETYQKERKADTLVSAFRGALLTGGNADRGRAVYTDNAASSCSRCHSLRGRGADVGPNLSAIGATLTREQLLEALLEPNARISPGFGTVAIKLKSGQQIEGTLREDTDTEVVVTAGTPVVEQRISKADIAERTNPVSAMPPMGLLLKPREIRDLVQFLSTLK